MISFSARVCVQVVILGSAGRVQLLGEAILEQLRTLVKGRRAPQVWGLMESLLGM